jgi:hypothetical protein
MRQLTFRDPSRAAHLCNGGWLFEPPLMVAMLTLSPFTVTRSSEPLPGRSGRQHWPFLQSNPQEDDMLRDVMEGNAAHIEPPVVFALHARRQLGRHRRGHSFGHADQTAMALGGACRADRQPAQPRAAELRHPRRRRCRPASPLPEARAELPRDACDEVAPSSSNRDESAACATTPGIRQGSRWSIDPPG